MSIKLRISLTECKEILKESGSSHKIDTSTVAPFQAWRISSTIIANCHEHTSIYYDYCKVSFERFTL